MESVVEIENPENLKKRGGEPFGKRIEFLDIP
jgi:hypothetical protein